MAVSLVLQLVSELDEIIWRRVMRVGAVGYRPFVYNTNSVSSASLNKIKAIGNNLTESNSDFSGLTESNENINPLKVGETKNYSEMVDAQMNMGRMNAARIMTENPFL